MVHYVGLDVSLKQTSICVVSDTGSVVREGVVNSDPEAIAAFVRSKAPDSIELGLVTHNSHHEVTEKFSVSVPMDRASAAPPNHGRASL